MKKGLMITMGISFLFWIVLALVVRNYLSNRQDNLRDYIGTKVIWQGDTVEVINYDYWRGELKLSKGYNVSPEWIELNKVE